MGAPAAVRNAFFEPFCVDLSVQNGLMFQPCINCGQLCCNGKKKGARRDTLKDQGKSWEKRLQPFIHKAEATSDTICPEKTDVSIQ
jgi:hypothetical protein